MKFYYYKFLLLFLSIVFLASCKKDEDVDVYRPPVASIRFSSVSDFIIDSKGKNITVKAQISSDNGLAQVALVYGPWNLNKVYTSFDNPSKFDLNEVVTIPANAALQIHSLKLEVTDTKGNKSTTEVKVGLEDLNYADLYLADVTLSSDLTKNLFGVPVMEKISSHTYKITYYAKEENVKLKFIPNSTSFSPVAIGSDPSNQAKLITDGTKSQPIVLSKKGYYEITVNTLLLTYNVKEVPATGAAFNQVALVGRGFYDYPNMNWQNTLPNIILLDKDSTNPFLFTKTVKLGIPAGQSYNTAQFILTTNNGWTDFWRFDNGTLPRKAVFNGGANADLPITATPQTYRFVFDSQTGIIQAIKQ